MIASSIKIRRQAAVRDFKRRLIILVIAGLLMVAAALFYLSSYGPMTMTLVVTVTAGVFVSVVLGGGLMAAGFFSSTSGVDESVAAATDPRRTLAVDPADAGPDRRA